MKTAILRFGETNLYGLFKGNDAKKTLKRNREMKLEKAYNIDIVDELKSAMKQYKLEKHWHLVDEGALEQILEKYEVHLIKEEVKKC